MSESELSPTETLSPSWLLPDVSLGLLGRCVAVWPFSCIGIMACFFSTFHCRAGGHWQPVIRSPTVCACAVCACGRAGVRGCVCVCVCGVTECPVTNLFFVSRGTQHFTGTVSNEATSEVGYPAWPAGRTCISDAESPFGPLGCGAVCASCSFG